MRRLHFLIYIISVIEMIYFNERIPKVVTNQVFSLKMNITGHYKNIMSNVMFALGPHVRLIRY